MKVSAYIEKQNNKFSWEIVILIYKKIIGPQTEIFQGMLNTSIKFTPGNFYVKLCFNITNSGFKKATAVESAKDF